MFLQTLKNLLFKKSLILIRCKTNENYKYGNVGDTVISSTWDRQKFCDNKDFYGLKEGNGDWTLLCGEDYDWIVIEANNLDIINIHDRISKFRTGKILFRGTTEQLANSTFSFKFKLNEDGAYHWALKIGNRDIMIEKITTPKYAYYWARFIGNRDVMINKINNSESAYEWAYYIGNRDIMIEKITESEYAYKWAKYIGNRDVMISKINDSKYAAEWIANIGDKHIMKDKVTYWQDEADLIMFNNIYLDIES